MAAYPFVAFLTSESSAIIPRLLSCGGLAAIARSGVDGPPSGPGFWHNLLFRKYLRFVPFRYTGRSVHLRVHRLV